MGADQRGHATDTRMRSRIVMAEREPGAITIDCVTDEVQGPLNVGLEIGTPFTVRLKVPHVSWRTFALSTLGRWADATRAVEMEFYRYRGESLLWISDGTNKMLLDVLSIAGLRVGA